MHLRRISEATSSSCSDMINGGTNLTTFPLPAVKISNPESRQASTKGPACTSSSTNKNKVKIPKIPPFYQQSRPHSYNNNYYNYFHTNPNPRSPFPPFLSPPPQPPNRRRRRRRHPSLPLIALWLLSMAQKRPFDEVVDEVSSKHQKQDGPGAEIISLHGSDETNTRKGEVGYHNGHESGSCPDILKVSVEDNGSDAPSLSHWATGATSVEDEPLEEMSHLPFSSGYFSFNLDRPGRPACNPDDMYDFLLDYSPRKRVPIGHDHQAEIPPCVGNTSIENPGDLNLNGTCIMPNSETQPLAHSILKAGDGRIDCRCPDQGSIRCVRAHVAEAREKQRKLLGQDTFMELGFNGMGEFVAGKWTNEEEQFFHEVVYSNPVSLGRKFWDALSAVFPSRTKMEIVSYYFNVFMLRKRAEQNRCDPMNVDSDNDEWQGSDDDDDDSGIESPAHNDGIVFHQNVVHAHNYEDGDGDVSDDAQEMNGNDAQGSVHYSDANTAFQFPGKKFNGGENDVQDGSCTSSDSGASQEVQTPNDGCHDWHEYILDSTYAKAWDGYVNCPKSNIDLDFLPTCSMIEEVFGGDLESKDKRW